MPARGSLAQQGPTSGAMLLFNLPLAATENRPLQLHIRGQQDQAIVTLNGAVLDGVEADVLGTGSMMLLMLTLLISPLSTITRQRWFVPLRRWYGVMFAITAFIDATAAAITTNFAGGVFGRLAPVMPSPGERALRITPRSCPGAG